jgi:hypothetical protein
MEWDATILRQMSTTVVGITHPRPLKPTRSE